MAVARRFPLVLLGLLAMLAACSRSTSDRTGGQRPKTARVLTMAGGTTDPAELTAFAAAVGRLSGHSLQIKLAPGWKGGSRDYETRLIGDVRAGRAQLGWAGSRAWDTAGVNSFRALAAPFLIDTYPLEADVLKDRAIVQPMLQDLQPLGLVGLGVLPGPMRRPMGTGRALVRPAAFSGLTIGVQQSRVADVTLRALGATPIRIPALPTDITRLGGIELHVSGIDGWRYDKPGTQLAANVDLWPRPLVLFANRAAFDSLGGGQQHALREAAATVLDGQITLDRALDHDATGDICRAGTTTFATATPDDLASLRRAVRPVYDELERDRSTREPIAAIQKLKRDLGNAPPDALPACGSPGTPAAPRSSPVDGVFSMYSSLKRDSAHDPVPVPENYGKWTFVFTRGRFAITQEDKQACTWGYGTYTVNGHRVEWTFTDGGGIAPNDAANKPGEFFEFGWSRYRDTLTLTPVPGQVSPLNFRVKPWRRISGTPTRSRFARRCPPPAVALPATVPLR